MRTHTTIGARILGGSAAPLLQLAEVIALSHHERWDGTGYPLQLARRGHPARPAASSRWRTRSMR